MNAANGRQRWHSKPGLFTSWPSDCPGLPDEVCATSAAVGHGPAALSTKPSSPPTSTAILRFNAATGAQQPQIVISTKSAGREIGEGLYDPGSRSPDMLTAVTGANVAWTAPLSQVFSTPTPPPTEAGASTVITRSTCSSGQWAPNRLDAKTGPSS